jgi:hypothetical protein
MSEAHQAALLAAVSSLRTRGRRFVNRAVRLACRDPARCVHPAVFSASRLDALHPAEEFPTIDALDGDWSPGPHCNLCMREDVRAKDELRRTRCTHEAVLLGESGFGEPMYMCLLCAHSGRERIGSGGPAQSADSLAEAS